MSFFNNHTHTHYSNIRLLDSINKPKDLINRAIELGLSGIAITDHECLSASIEVNQYAKEIHKTHPDFTIALGNEIYLTDTRDKGQKYYHFILIAKDAIGHKALRELSSTAWLNSYFDRGMERVPLLKTELASIMEKYSGHVIGTTACIGGQLGLAILNLTAAETAHNEELRQSAYQEIVEFIQFCISVFGKDDFYLECAPATSKEQIIVNKRIESIAAAFDLKICIGTDAHYLNKEDRYVHKAYLNSKGGERETDQFYEFSRLMDEEEVRELLAASYSVETIDRIIETSNEMRMKIEYYDLSHSQIIPKVKPTFFYKKNDLEEYETLHSLLNSDNEQERCWINECLIEMKNRGFDNSPEYMNRLEEEAKIIKYTGEQLNDCLFAYFITLKHYIDLFWECGSIVGPGRGSATGFLSNLLLGITQLDPIKEGLVSWRFLNEARAHELPDIDIDLAPSKRSAIFREIRKERGELGLLQVATFGTESTKSTILSSCRGYRSEEYPDGIDVDIAQYISSLVPQERGFLYSLNDLVYGNEEKGRKPNKIFLNEVNKYPRLLEIMMSIDGLVNKRSSHASGVIMFDETPYDIAAIMKTPSGDLITQYDLHSQEKAGGTKYDYLVTEVSDKIITCIELLQKDGLIEDNLSLREIYNKYLHPESINTTDDRIWEHLAKGDILDVFQFNEGSGLAIAKKLKPKNITEMTFANAAMRLMSEKGVESQQDRCARIQAQGLHSFHQELERNHLPQEVAEKLKEYCDEYYGCCALQETMMAILMDVANFSLAEVEFARKTVAKKKMNDIPRLRQLVEEKLGNESWVEYFWNLVISPSLGYAFSKNHSTPYSYVGVQTLYLATNFNPIYWNTACLIVNSGSLEAAEVEDEEDDKKASSTDYTKIAKAIGEIRTSGIKVSLADINKSSFGFRPDVENNQILYGLKGITNVSDALISQIIENRPYKSMKDFMIRVSPNKQAMIALIKAGAFDNFNSRYHNMVEYIWLTCDKKKRLTLQNVPSLIKHNLLPETTEDEVMARRIYEFNRYLKAACKIDSEYYQPDERAKLFLIEIGQDGLIENNLLSAKAWDKKVYQPWMDVFRNWIAANKDKILDNLNTSIFMEDWNKYASGNLSSWEMESLCFYYHEHELVGVNKAKYGIDDFNSLPPVPVVEKVFRKGDREIPIFKLNRICGTCIAKNKTKSTVYLLTETGVVPVKFAKEYFAMFDRQLSRKNPDGTKTVVEKSWFNRCNKIFLSGIRRGDEFVPKKYKNSGLAHQLYHIDSIDEQGNLELRHERKGEVDEDEV